LTGKEDKAGRVTTVLLNRDAIASVGEKSEHRLVKPGRDGWSGEYGVDAPVEDCEHRLVTMGRRNECGGCDLGESAPTVNGTISTHCKREVI
jgi:hypothetical protein